jgi:hypothetical protein
MPQVELHAVSAESPGVIRTGQEPLLPTTVALGVLVGGTLIKATYSSFSVESLQGRKLCEVHSPACVSRSSISVSAAYKFLLPIIYEYRSMPASHGW